jgi:hypothetical protein
MADLTGDISEMSADHISAIFRPLANIRVRGNPSIPLFEASGSLNETAPGIGCTIPCGS